MAHFLKFFYFIFNFSIFYDAVFCEFNDMINENAVSIKTYMFWPEATVPFYITPQHFDHTQSLAIMNAIAYISFKTCIKFVPVQDCPKANEHVLVFENPEGIRKCVINSGGNSIDEPHRLLIGYDCLRAPEIDMLVLRALGFPFEHNRSIRDLYIEIQPENFEPSVAELFAKEFKMPLEFRSLPYDINSVMHFGDREYSKNGHRVFLFKDPNTSQRRGSLTALDIRKIEIVYGPECRKRERTEKIEMCQNIPDMKNLAENNPSELNNDIVPFGRAKRDSNPDALVEKNDETMRRKREIGNGERSLRVNPDITPPPSPTVRANTDVTPPPSEHPQKSFDQELEDLGIKSDVERIIEEVYKVTRIALEHARSTYCNKTKASLRTYDAKPSLKPVFVSDIVWSIVNYTKITVDKALLNMTQFCADSDLLEQYQRDSCPFFNKHLCPKSYRSTKSGNVKYRTQHRPIIKQSTKYHVQKSHIFDSMYRSGNATENSVDQVSEVNQVFVNESITASISAGVSLSDASITDASAAPRRKRHAMDAVQSASSPTPSASIGSSPADSKVSSGHAPKSHSNSHHSKKGTKTRHANSKHGTRSGKAHRLRSSKHGPRSGNSSRIKPKTTSNPLKIKLPLSFENASAYGWVTWQPSNSSSELPKNDSKSSTVSGTVPSEPQFRAQNTTNSPKSNLRMGTTIVQDKRVYEQISREKRDVEAAENKRQKTEEIKVDVQGAKPTNDSRRYFQSRRFRINGQLKTNKKEWDQSKISLEEDGRRFAKSIKYKIHVPLDKTIVSERSFNDRHKDIEIKYRYQRKDREDKKVRKEREDSKQRSKKAKIAEESADINEEVFTKDSSQEDRIKPKKKEIDTSARGPPKKTKSKRPRTIPKTVKLTEKNVEFYRERMWPDGAVYFIVKDNKRYDVEDVRSRLMKVNDLLTAKTCTHIEEIKEEDVERYEDFLVLDDSPDYVTGRVGGRQNFGVVELLKGGQHRQHAAMMVMAMLGFYFEVARHDRDKYIRVHLRHVRPDKLHHFEKIRDDATFNLPYDYKSATHPAWQFWRQIGRTGISTVATYKEQDPDGSLMKSLGQNSELLSESDIIKINSIYGTECFGGEPSPTQLDDENTNNEKQTKPHKKRDDKMEEFDEDSNKTKDEETEREEQELQERANTEDKKRDIEKKSRSKRNKRLDLHDESFDKRVKKSIENTLMKRRPLVEEEELAAKPNRIMKRKGDESDTKNTMK
ncbi:uncharacterized protein LOC113234574 [Hyposmocoma kahamanoa]|uniref:uncharacterized protein LOC113234574 n=1 Tax=Hyposmocoma kahamanoa TaxID=1477025 RepID=UPI000E6D8E0B|nr:uncharacterized protein LOC113234574 [Hyposmocoma kahamanoa]